MIFLWLLLVLLLAHNVQDQQYLLFLLLILQQVANSAKERHYNQMHEYLKELKEWIDIYSN